MEQHIAGTENDAWRWPHFSMAELACRCGGRFCAGMYHHDPAFLDALERMRATVGRPLVINSGHRCAQWNAAVGGAPMSMHKVAIAADISVVGHGRGRLLRAARAAGFTGIGLARSFIHVDLRAQPAGWIYKGSEGLWPI